MAYIDRYTIRNGDITLYRRTAEGGKYQSKSWYCALKFPDQKTIRRSLKVKDKSKAESLARDLWYTLSQRNSRGLSLTPKRFELIANGYISKLEEISSNNPSDKKHSDTATYKKKLIVDQFLLPYFGGLPIQDITDQKVSDYIDWRKDFWLSGDGSKLTHIEYKRKGRTVRRPKNRAERSVPSWNTINKDLAVLRQIFEYARRSNVIEGREIPTIRNVCKPRNISGRKPGLSDFEVNHLVSVLLNRLEAQTNTKHRQSHKLLIHYIVWMCSTGIRVSEAKNLKFSDCKTIDKNGKQYLKVFVHGKGKSRELIAQPVARTTLSQLHDLHAYNATIQRSTNRRWLFDPRDSYVFIDQYGNRVGSFANSLNRAFRDANLLYDAHGAKRSGSAFRKHYITNALLVGKVNYFELAKQTGTSISVIEKYYAEIDPSERPEM